MQSQRRDAALALFAGAVLLGSLRVVGALSALLQSRAVVVGVGGALFVEALFVAPTPVARWWERPSVQVGATVALVGGSLLVARRSGPWVFAAACWGLLTYFVLLVGVVAVRHRTR